MPLNHLALSASNLSISGEFYDAVLSPVGYTRHINRPDLLTWHGEEPEILLYLARQDSPHQLYDPGIHHVAFQLQSRDVVNAVYEKVMSVNGTILEGPKEYPNYPPDYYALFIEDPDGIKLEFMHR